MNGKSFLMIAVFHLAFFYLGLTQNQKEIDSLVSVLKTAKEDTGKAGILNRLAALYTYENPQKSFEYSSAALKLAQKLNSKKHIANSYQNISVYYYYTGNPQLAIEYTKKTIPIIEESGDKKRLCDAYNNLSNQAFLSNDYYGAFAHSKKALQIAEEINDSTRISKQLNLIGNNYRDISSDYPTALDYLFRALKINLALQQHHNLSYDYCNIGDVYAMEHDYDNAYEYYSLSIKTAEQLNNQLLVANCTNQIGKIYLEKNTPDSAEQYFSKAILICEKINANGGILDAEDGLAKVYMSKGKIEKALESANSALQVAEQLGAKDAISGIYLSFGNIYTKARAYHKANDYLNHGLIIAKELDRKDIQREIYASLTQNNEQLKNYKAAYEYQKEYINLNDSIAGEKIIKKTAELQARFDSEKKDVEIELLTKDKQVRDADLRKQKLLKNSFIASFALLAILSFFVFNNFRVRNKLRLQNIRNKIASDLHDDIGSTLNSISVYSEVAKQKSPAVVQELDQIGEASRRIIDAMSDIVWTINPKNDTFENIILRMRSLSYNLMKAKNIEHTFRADEDMVTMKLSMEARRNFFLIFKEAVNNLVKYSGATRASIVLTHENNLVKLSIRDNGKGFDVKQFSTGNGLFNMRSRAEEMNAHIKIESEPGKGTHIELALKA